MDTGVGGPKIALYTTLYAGALSGTLSLLALFLIGWELIGFASGMVPGSGETRDAAVVAFQFFNVLTILGGAVGSYYAAHYDSTRGAQTLPKSTLAAVNLLVVPLVAVFQAGGSSLALWVAFLAGAVMACVNLLALLLSQHNLTPAALQTGMKWTGAFALAALGGTVLERLAADSPGGMWLRFGGHLLLLAAAAFAAHYALLLGREVYDRARVEARRDLEA